MLAAKVYLSLRQLALCLDCDECFEIGSPTCPACGSATRTSLSRFLERVRQLVIVSRNRRHLYEYLERAFAGNETIRVFLDRRVVERRAHSGPYAIERRHGDRRSSRKTDGLLRALGWVIVPLGVPETHRGAAR